MSKVHPTGGFGRLACGWDKLAVPMLIIGVALVVTGIVRLIKPRRSKGSPGTAR